jgi:hypothetical protein
MPSVSADRKTGHLHSREVELNAVRVLLACQLVARVSGNQSSEIHQKENWRSRGCQRRPTTAGIGRNHELICRSVRHAGRVDELPAPDSNKEMVQGMKIYIKFRI